MLEKLSKLVKDFDEGSPISVSRCYFDQAKWQVVSLSLCGFCDASMHAYGAVVYLVVRTEIKKSI